MTLLVGRQEGHPACKKTEWWGAGVVIRLELGTDLHMAQLMPLPLTVSCFSKIQIGSTFLLPAHPVVPEKGPLNGCVCVCKRVRVSSSFYYSIVGSDSKLIIVTVSNNQVRNNCIAVRKVARPLRELTCHMGSHSVTCHPAEVTFPPLPQPKLVLD